MSEAFIIGAARTPRGRGKRDKGALANVHPQELLAQTLQHATARAGVAPIDVDDIVIGCVTAVNDQGANLARHAMLSAGWPVTTTATTLNRCCGSGLQAVNFAAAGVMAGVQQLVVAGGVESMSRVAMGSDGPTRDGNNPKLRERFVQVPQGISADLIATLEGLSRQELDAFALQSQQKAAAATRERRFARSLFSVRDPFSGTVLLEQDECVRPTTTADALGALPPSFDTVGQQVEGPSGETLDELALLRFPEAGTVQHLHTAGNSSGIADGAAAVVVASRDYVQRNGLRPRARIRAMATAGADPVLMLTAPTPAVHKVLRAAGMEVPDIDLWEINEAFAAVPLKTIRDLGLYPDRVNVNGGAIALGHPLGATGAMLLGTALDELERRDATTALITLCIAGGQGIATIIERV